MGLTEPLKVKVTDRIVEMNLAVLKNQHNDVLLGKEWFGATDAGIYPSKGLLHMIDIIILVKVKKKKNKRKSYSVDITLLNYSESIY